jgi:hypothetical protein
VPSLIIVPNPPLPPPPPIQFLLPPPPIPLQSPLLPPPPAAAALSGPVAAPAPDVPVIPEAESQLLLGVGLGAVGLLASARRRRR